MRAFSAVVAVAVGCWFCSEPVFAQDTQGSGAGRSTSQTTLKRDTALPKAAQGKGKGRGIGRSVSQAARNGVHGQQLAGQVQQFQATQGIGRRNAGGHG